MIIGSFFLLAGVIALLLAPVIWRRGKNLLFFWLGLLLVLYGSRLLLRTIPYGPGPAIPADVHQIEAMLNYLIPVPFFLFTEAVFGRGWRSILRRIWQIHLVYAFVALPFELLSGTPARAEVPYQILVLGGQAVLLVYVFLPAYQTRPEQRIFRWAYLILVAFIVNENLVSLGIVPWPFEVEHVGALVFFGLLGFIALRGVVENERRLAAISHELETARRIQQSILPPEIPRMTSFDLAVRYLPMTEVAGDYYDFFMAEKGRLGVLVADVCGHGIPAALVGSMVKVAFSSQVLNGSDPARTLQGMNETLHGNLGDSYLTAGYFVLDTGSRKLTWAGAAHPPLLIWRAVEGRLEKIPSTGGLIGPFPHLNCENRGMELAPGDRVVVYTDGIVEATNARGAQFGMEAFADIIREQKRLNAESLASIILDRIRSWSGRKNFAVDFDDDLTLIILDIQQLP